MRAAAQGAKKSPHSCGLFPAGLWPLGTVRALFVEKKFHLHLVSDSTGETLNAMVGAALAQFENVEVQIHSYALVRSEHQLSRALDQAATAPGLVFFTLASKTLNQRLVQRCVDLKLDCIDVLERPLNVLGKFLGKVESHKVGRQHQVDQRYLDRIETLNFAIAHDDGQALDGIANAEVILTGASRTSKTPTCVYLAIRGVRAANVPLVPGMQAPPALLAAQALVVGLWVSPDWLVQVRRNRLSTMGETRNTDYVDLDQVRAEVAATKALFENQGWPTIDVTRRSIEETAATVMNLLSERKAEA